jgi:hypothetical protein
MELSVLYIRNPESESTSSLSIIDPPVLVSKPTFWSESINTKLPSDYILKLNGGRPQPDGAKIIALLGLD